MANRHLILSAYVLRNEFRIGQKKLIGNLKKIK